MVLDVYQEKDFVEIVGWRMVNEKGLAKMQRQAEREGGQFLILSPNDGSAAALSALPLGLSSESEGTAQDVNLQENAQKSGENNQPDVPDFFRLGGKNYSVASRNADGSVDVTVDGKRETLPAGTDYSSLMPTDKKGDVIFTAMPVERTHEYFVQKVTNDKARALMIEKNRKKAEAERKKFDKDPDVGLDPDKWEEDNRKWEEGKKAAQAKVDYWNEVAKRDAEITRSETREAVENIKPDVVAFEKKNSVSDNTTDTGETSNGGKQNDTATLQNTVSTSKSTTQSANKQENRQENAGNSTLEQIKAELKDLRKKIAVNGNKLRRMLHMSKYEQLTADLRDMNSLLTTVTAEQAKEEYGIDINKWDEVKYDALWAERDQLKQQIKAAEERLKNAESAAYDVQGGGQNGVAQEEVPVNEPVGNSEQLSSSEIPNNQSVAEGNAPGQRGVDHSLSQEEAQVFITEMEANAEVAPEIELTIENWDSLFGEDGLVETPIGEVKMGENQFTKLMRQGRDGKLGMVKPTLENPDVIIEDESKAKNGETERPSSYVFVKSFKKADGSRYYYFTSVTVSKDGKEGSPAKVGGLCKKFSQSIKEEL